MAEKRSHLVYSTDRQVPRKKDPDRAGYPAASRPVTKTLTVMLARKGRGGKTVTLVEGLRMPGAEKEALLRKIKSELGTGGTETASGFEVQGDHCDALMNALQQAGLRPKRSGG